MTARGDAAAGGVTTVICVRNGATTIARAVQSALAQGGPVVVVDDASEDGSAAIAAGCSREVRVVALDRHRTLGAARAAGVDAVRTCWLQWLDADDELLPGRSRRLLALAHDRKWDAVWEGVQLHDGRTGAWLRELPMPPFMGMPGASVRQFERNHTPGPAWPLVRRALARRLGYAVDLPTGDDLDFMLRACCAGARLGFVNGAGYRQFAYAASLSRDRAHQQAWVAAVLGRHAYRDVRIRYLEAGWSPRIAAWALASMATFRRDWSAALQFVDEACPVPTDEVLEPHGPWPVPEAWRRAFQRGTVLLLAGGRDREALRELHLADALLPSADAANNLGVALFRLGCEDGASAAFARALQDRPDYADARANAAAAHPARITAHPLRRWAARADYA
jgi:hypothetical protein